MGSEKAYVLLTPRPASCIFQTADEKDDPAADESVLEMLSYSKFSDLETWLCMPSSVRFPRSLDSSSSSSSSCCSVRSTGSVPGSNSLSLNASRHSLCSQAPDSQRSDFISFLSPKLVRDPKFLSAPVLTHSPLTPSPVTSSPLTPSPLTATPLTPSPLTSYPLTPSPLTFNPLTPSPLTSLSTSVAPDPMTRCDSSACEVTVRKRRRLATRPGGLHWTSAGSVQRHFSSAVSPGGSEGRGLLPGVTGAVRCKVEGVTLRKSLSDDRFLQNSEPKLKQLTRNLCSPDTGGVTRRYDSRKKPAGGSVGRLAQKWKRWSLGDGLNSDVTSWFYSGLDQSSGSLDRKVGGAMQQIQSLQLTPRGRCPTSPNAAKRLYRNLSDKLRGSSSSIEDSYFFGKSDRLRKASTAQYSEVLFEAVEQQDLDTVQILLFQFGPEELDLNSPNDQGLTVLDISIMTNNSPIAKLLLRAGAKESPHFSSLEAREAHLSSLVLEAERRAADLAAQAQRDGLSLEAVQNHKALRSWEWRSRLYARMRTGFRSARFPEAPSMVRLTVSSSSTLGVTFQEPQGLNSNVVTKYRVEWSCLKDFSLLAGDTVLDNLQSLRFTITGLATGRVYFVRVSCCNIKGWGPPACSLPPSAAPSNWRESDNREQKPRAQIDAIERLLQQVRATHSQYCSADPSKLQSSSRKPSVSRSLKHLFNSNKFVKTLKRGVYLATVLHHKDCLLVTAEEQIPIVEVDDSFGSSLMQDFLWFTKLSCLWEDVRWLRQSLSVSMSSSSTLQSRHKLLTAAAHMQNLLGTHNLGRVHYEPIKDRHGNVILVTVRELDPQTSSFNGKWTAVTKLQSQRKSLSTPEEPYALDILIITLQDLLSFQRRCSSRLSPGLYLGFLKLSSSVDQIRVLVSQRSPNVLCHVKVRENANVSREEWEWFQSLSSADSAVIGGEAQGAGPASQSHAPLLYYELQTATKSLLKQLNLSPHQAGGFRLYSQEVVELGHGVSFLLLLPAADDVCSAPGQTNPLSPLSGFLHLPLKMFELVHLCSYKERYISLCCRVSSVLDLDFLITQQNLREAISDEEVLVSKERHQRILEYTQQLEEVRKDLRWLTEALQFARYKQPRGGVPLRSLLPLMPLHTPRPSQNSDSTSSNMDYLPTPSPSPEPRRRTGGSDSLLCSDEDGSSEVFLPTDSDYDSSGALSPLQDSLSPSLSPHLPQTGSAPNVLRSGICPSASCPSSFQGSKPEAVTAGLLLNTSSEPSPCASPLSPTVYPLSPGDLQSLSPSVPPVTPCVPPMSPCVPPLTPSTPPLTPCAPPLSLCVLPLAPGIPPLSPIDPPLSPVSEVLDALSLSCRDVTPPPSDPAPMRPLPCAPAKRKLLSRSHRGQYFSGPQRWIRTQSRDAPAGTQSEGIYTRQDDVIENLTGVTYVSHASCVLEKKRNRESRPHVRKIFTQNAIKTSPSNDEGTVLAETSPTHGKGKTGTETIPACDTDRTSTKRPTLHKMDVKTTDSTHSEERGGRRRGFTGGRVTVMLLGAESENQAGEGPVEVDSDDQTNTQIQEILSSAL